MRRTLEEAEPGYKMVYNKQGSEKFESAHLDFSGEGSLEPAGTDTDSGLSGSTRDVSKLQIRSASEGLSEESSSPVCHSPKDNYTMSAPTKISVSPSASMEGSDVADALEGCGRRSPVVTWVIEEEDIPPVQLKIEEHVEEITTHHITDEDSISSGDGGYGDLEGDGVPSGSDTPGSNPRQREINKCTYRKRRFASRVESDGCPSLLSPMDLPSISDHSTLDSTRVPFPELGVDLLPDTTDGVDGGPSELVLESSNWKENWLFRTEKRTRIGRPLSVDTITMLIPNPSSTVPPTIGDRDIDELSELSDRHSTYSFEMSSDEEGRQPSPKASRNLVDLVDEISAEFGQQDHEYTEDTTIVDRLHLRNGYTVSTYTQTSNESDPEEMTAVTPVPKPRKHLMGRTNSSKTSERGVSLMTKAQRREMVDRHTYFSRRNTDPALVPPEAVPSTIDRNSQSSPSVRIESGPQDQLVPLGRALRITCQVHSKQRFGLGPVITKTVREFDKTYTSQGDGDLQLSSLCCFAIGLSWYHNGNLIRDGKNIISWKKGDMNHLNVFEMSHNEAGTYYICAYTREDVVWTKFQVMCTDQGRANKGPRINLGLSDVIIEAGSDVALECQVGGHPEPNVTFIRNSVPLTSSDNCFIENDQYGTWILHLLAIKEGHGGQIKAIASNSLGHVLTSCIVTVVPEGQIINKPLYNTSKKPEVSHVLRKKKKSGSQSGNCKIKDPQVSVSSTIPNSYENRYHLSPNNSDSAVYINSRLDPKRISHRPNNNHNDVSRDSIDGFPCKRDTSANDNWSQPPKPGTIAEREHRKWLEAKPLPNNPYSPEKLAHRLGQMSSRFPGLPSVCKDTSGDENTDPYVGDGLTSSSSDLSRYSRDYHINRIPGTEQKHRRFKKNELITENNFKETQRTPSCLVRIEAKRSSNWREELRDIKLDVGKKVADIQKTIDDYQHEWKRRLQQKGWNPCTRKRDFKHVNQKLSSSCINLSTPPKTKSFISSTQNRHLIYSSSEALNSTKARDQNLWRTVSVDTLNSAPKFSIMASNATKNHEKWHNPSFDSRESIENKRGPFMSDSDDSSLLYTSNSYVNSSSRVPEGKYNQQNGQVNKRLTSYYSENSIESLKEESDTGGSSSTVGDSSNLPSVKELASKFDSTKHAKNKANPTKKNHEKPLRSRDTEFLKLDQQDQNDSMVPPYNNAFYSKKYNDKVALNEVHHSLTARSVSRSFREGLRLQAQRPQPVLETLTDESVRFAPLDCPPQLERDTASPEHLGIPSSPASIPNRHPYPYPPPGDTSDDSMVAGMMPRKNYRKKMSSATSSKPVSNDYNLEFHAEQIYDWP